MPAPTAHLKFTADNRDLHEAANQNLRDLDRQAQGSAQLSRSVGQLVAVFLSLQTAQQLLQSAKLGEDFLNARAEFSRFVSDYEAGSQRLQQATRGTLSEIKTLQLANEAFRQGLDFQTVETAFQFAEQQADRTGDKIETVFEQVSRALAKTEAGVGRNNSILVRYGITGTNTVEILKQMNKQLGDQDTALDDNSDAVSQYEARWTDAITNIGVAVRTLLLPSLETAAQLGQIISGGEYQELLDATRFLRPIIPTALDKDTRNAVDTSETLINGLLEKLSQGTSTADDFSNAIAAIGAASESAIAYKNNFAELLALLEKMQATRSRTVTTNTPFGPDERDAEKNQQLLDQIAADRERADREAQQSADAATARRREQLQQARDEAKLNIQLNQATYADLKTLLDQQAADNQQFFAQDKAAYLSWLADRAVVYQQDKQNAAEAQAAIYNLYRGTVDDILESEYLSSEEKFRMSREAIDFALKNENLDLEQRRIFSQQKQQIERDYTNFLLQEYQQQIQLLNNLFGQPALQLIDQFFSGAEVRFEDFLKNILRNLAQYYAQMGLFSLFGMILGGPAVGAGGIIGGGLRGGGGILSLPGLPDLTTLPQSSITNITRNYSPGPGSPQVSVQILATPEQLYAVTRTGQTQYNRSSGL